LKASETEMIVDLIRVFQPDASVTVYQGVIYVNGTPLKKRY